MFSSGIARITGMHVITVAQGKISLTRIRALTQARVIDILNCLLVCDIIRV